MQVLPVTRSCSEFDREASLLGRRMVALGLAPEAVERTEIDIFFDLKRLCVRCECNDRCEADLDDRPADGRWVEYCPNALVLKALAEQW